LEPFRELGLGSNYYIGQFGVKKDCAAATAETEYLVPDPFPDIRQATRSKNVAEPSLQPNNVGTKRSSWVNRPNTLKKT
jgi:hypothetical protein